MPAPLKIHQGDDVSFDATIYEDEDETTPKDMTGGTVTGRIGLASVGQGDLEVSGSVLNGPLGQVRVTFASADTAGLAAALYDVQIIGVDNGGNQGVPVDRKLRVRPLLPAPA